MNSLQTVRTHTKGVYIFTVKGEVIAIGIINIKVTVLLLLNEEEYDCFLKDAEVRSFFPHRESRFKC